MRVAGIRNFQPRCTILPEKKKTNKQSFMEEEDQNRMLTLSLRACGRRIWGLRGLETHTEIKRGNK